MNKEIVMTKSGYAAVETELEELKTVKRKEVAEKIKVARGYGDLSENSEYDEAKNEQGMLESRIAELEKMLKHARVLDSADIDTSVISVGSHVKIQDEDGDTDEYDITGSTEADPLNGRISDESPVGAALLGHSAGDQGGNYPAHRRRGAVRSAGSGPRGHLSAGFVVKHDIFFKTGAKAPVFVLYSNLPHRALRGAPPPFAARRGISKTGGVADHAGASEQARRSGRDDTAGV